jgi:hypothetical protein
LRRIDFILRVSNEEELRLIDFILRASNEGGLRLIDSYNSSYESV